MDVWIRVGGLATMFLVSVAEMAAGQAQTQSTLPSAPGTGSSRVARAIRVERPPRMDGTLNDPIWQQAPPITDFRQREPLEGQPATEYTEVRVLYTRNEVYFGIACRDSMPHGVTSK